MEPKLFLSQNFSLFIVKFKKLEFSAPLKTLMHLMKKSEDYRNPEYQHFVILPTKLSILEFCISMLDCQKFNFA